MASGDYTGDRRSDPTVVWSDGETTLTADSGRGALGKENTLVHPGT